MDLQAGCGTNGLFALLLGYLLGSVPTAYLLVRWQSQLDIRRSGSGNVGALNSFEVTGRRWVGAAVLFVDAAKGAGAVLLAGQIWEDPRCMLVAGVGAVLGHTVSIWIGLRGGRGLATGAGVVALVAWPGVLCWLALWAIARAFRRGMQVANATATVVLLAALFVVPGTILAPGIVRGAETPWVRGSLAAIFLLILAKLLRPVLEEVHLLNHER
jgi:acyl phosphate:glycerol-3-phosphate acyltransferase